MDTANGALGREQILTLVDRKIEDLDVPEWGGGVHVRSMTVEDKNSYQASLTKRIANGQYDVDLKDSNAKLVVRVLCDQHGERLFADHEYPLLNDKSAAAIERIAEVGRRLSGMGDEVVQALEKNSASAPSDGSSSA